jgi:NTP pyrophosphatase (non-canonical NTP hydrolase)
MQQEIQDKPKMLPLDFATLRLANTKRLPLFKNNLGERAHSSDDGSDWSVDAWIEATIGELGEYANVSKKFRRAEFSEAEFKIKAGKELADAVIYLDIAAFRMGLKFEEFIHDGTALVTTFAQLRTFELNHNPSEFDRANLLVQTTWLVTCVLQSWLMQSEERTRFNIAQAMLFIDIIARIIGVDLQEAVFNKFNEVSDRLGIDVIIKDDMQVFVNGVAVTE